MIFADKLIELRKKSGMTQEELADKMDVTRQAIAKWEGMQSVPELTKIIKLSEIFEVSTDYLLKDELGKDEHIEVNNNDQKLKVFSMEDAHKFLKLREKASTPMAIAVLLCIFSPITLIILSALTQIEYFNISDTLAVGVGMGVLLIFVAIAVSIFISIDNKNSEFKFLDMQLIDTEYGVDGMVKSKRDNYKLCYDRFNLIGVIICILSVILIFVGLIIDKDNAVLFSSMICGMIALIGIAVFLFVKVGVVWGSFQKILQDGEYSKEKKKEKSTIIGAVSSIYWIIATIVYLGISFLTKRWDITWIVWVVNGIIYPVIIAILRAKNKRDGEK